MIRKPFYCATVLVAIYFSNSTQAATCSCASVPILGSMESSSPNKNAWFFSASYETHEISDLVSGSREVNDETGRDRSAQSLVLETSRGISDTLSVAALISSVEQRRRVGNNPEESASGIGDAVFLFKYTPQKIRVYSNQGFSVGAGARVPLGEDEAKSQSGIVLAEDMQPSTGAYGGILWAHYNYAFNRAATRQLYATASYTSNGDNKRDYRFGDELVFAAGTQFHFKEKWGLTSGLKFRETERDRRAGSRIPNTGGQWLDFESTLQYHVNDSLATRLSFRLPVQRDLNDELQFTSSYSFGFGVSFVYE